MFDRRWFLSSGIVIGGAAVSNQLFVKIASAPKHLPVAALYSGDEDSYWAEIRKQFLIPEDEAGQRSSSPIK